MASSLVLIRIPKNARYYAARYGNNRLWLWEDEEVVTALHTVSNGRNVYAFTSKDGNNNVTSYHVYAEDVEEV